MIHFARDDTFMWSNERAPLRRCIVSQVRCWSQWEKPTQLDHIRIMIGAMTKRVDPQRRRHVTALTMIIPPKGTLFA
jgi:hypothetical protein